MSNDLLLNENLQDLPEALQRLEPALLEQAFTHRSRRSQDVARHETNERLEFLGDAVIELYISEYLLEKFPESDEGQLTRLRAHIVRTESLAAASIRLQLGQRLSTSKSESRGEAANSTAVLADTFESVTGALYTQFGYAEAGKWLEEQLLAFHANLEDIVSAKDPKSQLQEVVQSMSLNTPEYRIVTQEGPDHAKTFTVEASIDGFDPIQGVGASKQKAEQAAAEAALAKYFPSQNNVV